ncbi:hypothetical protein LTR86_000219 [Recurvomyces mirabilis]|nr:hypothetical protein LTR86_000219 [Recurvomyces mirabilis]
MSQSESSKPSKFSRPSKFSNSSKFSKSSNFSKSSMSISYSSSDSTADGQKTGKTETKTTQDLGEPEVKEIHRYDKQGRKLPAGIQDPNQQEQRQVKNPNDGKQAERDRKYEDRMEDEYAKREGGA